MIRRSVSCMLAGLLLVGSVELYAFCGTDMWTFAGSGYLGVILLFTGWIGFAWLREELQG